MKIIIYTLALVIVAWLLRQDVPWVGLLIASIALAALVYFAVCHQYMREKDD